MKKRIIITTEKREVWVIHQAHHTSERNPNAPAVVDMLNGLLSPPTEQCNDQEPTPTEEVENEFEKLDPGHKKDYK